MAARTGERCYWWCSQGLQVIQLHIYGTVQNPTMNSYQTILSIDTSHHITTCYTLPEDIRAIVLLLSVRPGRVVETLNKKSHQGDAMGGRNPPTTVMATNNNCQKKLYSKKQISVIGKWPFFWEKVDMLSACAFFIALCLWLICVDVESRKWTSDLKKLMVWDTFIESSW